MFAQRAVDAGASGLIVPDLPLEESGAVLEACDAAGLSLVPLVAPTSPDERLARIGAQARGFLYTVSVTGTTGERTAGRDAFAPILARAHACTSVPVALGFGIGTPDQAAAAADAGADGVIIGSRLVRAVAESPESPSAVRDLVAGFSEALRAVVALRAWRPWAQRSRIRSALMHRTGARCRSRSRDVAPGALAFRIQRRRTPDPSALGEQFGRGRRTSCASH